jgi:hypothetical protein
MAVGPTLRTAAVGVTRAGRRDGGRRLAHGNRLNSVIRFAFSGIRPMARLLSRLPTQASHDNMSINRAE